MVNECLNNNGGCGHICVDHYQGSYCVCRDGYELIPDPQLANNCPLSPPGNRGSNTYCMPAGKYFNVCWCWTAQPQYSVNGTQCRDTNECAVRNGGCEDRCTNTEGSYQCSCSNGFTLDDNRHDCADINECATGNPCSGGQICVNTYGSYHCINGAFGVASGLTGTLTSLTANVSTTTLVAVIAVVVLSLLNVVVLSIVVTRWARRRRQQAGSDLASLGSSSVGFSPDGAPTFNTVAAKFST